MMCENCETKSTTFTATGIDEPTTKIEVRAGYHHAQYGKHGPEIDFIVKCSKGATVYTIHTGWYFSNTDPNYPISAPYSVGIAFHEHPTQANLAEGDNQISEHCNFLDGPCVSSWAGSHSDLIETLKRQGSEGLFSVLILAHKEHFKN